MTRRSKRLLRVLLWLVVALLGVIAAALITAKLVLTPERLARLIERVLEANLKGKFSIARIEWHLPAGIVAYDLSADSPRGDRVLAADRLDGRLSIGALLSRQIRVRSIHLTSPRLWLRPPPPDSGSEVAFTLLEAFLPARETQEEPPPDELGAAWSVALEGINVRGIDLDLALDSRSFEVSGGIIRRGTLALDDTGLHLGGDLSIARFSTSAQDDPIDIGDAAITAVGFELAQRPGAALAIGAARAEITARGSTITASGRLQIPPVGDDPEALSIELSASGELDLSPSNAGAVLPKELAETLELDGRLSFEIEGGGTTGAASGRFTLTSSGMSALGIDVSRLEAAGTFAQDRVAVQSLSIEPAAGGAISGSAEVRFSGGQLAHRADLDVRALPLRELLARWVTPTVLPGSVTGELHVDGESVSPLDTSISAEADVSGIPEIVPAGSVPDPTFVRVDARVRGEVVSIRRLVASGRGVRLTASGRAATTPAGALDLDFSVVHDQPATLLRALKIPARAERAEIEGEIRGTLRAPEASARLEVRGLIAQDLPRADASIPLRYERGLLRAAGGQIRIAGGTITATAAAPLLAPGGGPLPPGGPAFEIDLDGSGLDLAKLTNGRARGQLSMSGHARGPMSELTGRFDVAVRSLSVKTATFSVARASVDADRGLLRVKSLDLRPEGGGVVLGWGTVSLPDKTLDLELCGEKIAVSVLGEALSAPVALGGTLALRGSLSGPLSSPVVGANLYAAGFEVEGQLIGDVFGRVDGPVTSAISGEASVLGPLGGVTAVGVLDIRQMRLYGSKVWGEVRALPELLALAGSDLPLEGVLSFEAALDGPLPSPSVHGEAVLRALRWDQQPIPGQVKVSIAPDTAAAPGVHRVAASVIDAVRVDGELRIGPPLEIDLAARFDRFRLSKIYPPAAELGVELALTGEIALEYGEKAGVSAKLSLGELRVDAGDAFLVNTEPVVASLSRGGIAIERLHLSGNAGEIDAGGSIGAGKLDLRAGGRLELGLLALIVPSLSAEGGQAQLEITTRGTPAAPDIDGRIALITPLEVRPEGIEQVATIETASIRFSRTSIAVEELAGVFGGGSFGMSGSIGLEGFTPKRYDLKLTGRSLPVRAPDLLIEADLDLTATGPGPLPQIRGDVAVLRGRYLKRFRLREFNFVAPAPSAETPIARALPWLSGVELDVHAVTVEAVEVKVDAVAFSATLNLSADVRVGGSAAEPAIIGRVVPEYGTLYFPRAELAVTSGAVDFPPTGEPVVSLTAQGEVDGAGTGLDEGEVFLVSLALSGTLSQMDLELTSTPDLERLAVLSLLVTGRTTLARTGGGDEAGEIDAALVFAGSQLAGPVTGALERELEQRLNVQLDLSTEVSSKAVRVLARTEVTQRIVLEGGYARYLVEGYTTTTGRARLLLTNRLSLMGIAETTIGVEGNETFDLGPRTEGRFELRLWVFGE